MGRHSNRDPGVFSVPVPDIGLHGAQGCSRVFRNQEGQWEQRTPTLLAGGVPPLRGPHLTCWVALAQDPAATAGQELLSYQLCVPRHLG